MKVPFRYLEVINWALLTGAIPYKNSVDRINIVDSLKKEFSNKVKVFVNREHMIIEYHLYQAYSRNLAH